MDEIVETSLKRAGLWNEVKDNLDGIGTSLSGGQQQRLCIARAIAVSPEVILMDEPASALDPIATAKIEELIDELRENYTIVIVTHSMQQAARVSQRTAFFHLGNLVEMGDTEGIFTNPGTQADAGLHHRPLRLIGPQDRAPRRALRVVTAEQTTHTVRSFDADLQRLSHAVVRAGGLVESQLGAAMQALTRRDSALAAEVVAGDARVDAMERDIQDAPCACWPCASRWPRICARSSAPSASPATWNGSATTAPTSPSDPWSSIRRRRCAPSPPCPAWPAGPGDRQGGPRRLCRTRRRTRHRVWRRDEELDDLHTSLFRDLVTYMMEDARTITACTHLMFIAKNIERIGDHATNIAEIIYYLVQGRPLRDVRPKGTGAGNREGRALRCPAPSGRVRQTVGRQTG